MTLEPFPELRRMVYGSVGLVVGVAINRVAGLHIILHHIATQGLDSANTAWFVVFCAGLALASLAPLWFWIVRPMLSNRARRIDPASATNE